jgi:hypothetical protein
MEKRPYSECAGYRENHSGFGTTPCGIELAREGVVSGNADAGFNILFASKLAPTGFGILPLRP